MTSVYTISTSYPMSDTSKHDSYQNNSSPAASMTSLQPADSFDHSLSAATYLESEGASQALSPPEGIHSGLYSDNQVYPQEYSMLNFVAYGLPATNPDVRSLRATQMLPYPSSTTPLITLGTGEHQARFRGETSQGHARFHGETSQGHARFRGEVREALNGLRQRNPDPYFQSQAIKEWSGACSTALSTDNAPSPNSWLPQEAPHISTSSCSTCLDSSECQSSAVPSSSQDWSTKNKLNLTVNTNVTALKATNRLSPNSHNPATPYSDGSTSNISPSASSFYYEPQHPAYAPQLMPSSPRIINWLHGSLNAPQPNTGGSYFDALPTPSSATFSVVPTPTEMCYSSDFSHTSPKENPAVDINANQGNFAPQLLIQSSAPHSPSNLDLTSGLGYLPLTGSIHEAPYMHHDSSGSQVINSPTTYCCSLDDRIEYSSGTNQAQSPYSDAYHANSYDSSIPSSVLNPAATLEHVTSESGSSGQVEQYSAHSHSPHDSAISLPSSEYLSSSPVKPKGKRAISQLLTDSEEEQVSCKRRCSATSAGSLPDENINNPYQASDLSSLLKKKVPLVGTRLKPGPKSKTTLVQHPPPPANATGLNSARQDSGITKEDLKCLYTIIFYPPATAAGANIKRFLCSLEGCGRSFARKTAVESHLQTHLEDKPFVCSLPECNAAFVRQHDLRRHEQIHAKSKPHGCICGKNFARADALVRHRNRGICDGSLVTRRK